MECPSIQTLCGRFACPSSNNRKKGQGSLSRLCISQSERHVISLFEPHKLLFLEIDVKIDVSPLLDVGRDAG